MLRFWRSSPKRLTYLTSEQTAQLPRLRDKWLRIGLSTEPANRPLAEEGIRLAYQSAGLKPPARIVWVGSPIQGLVLWMIERYIWNMPDATVDEWGIWPTIETQFERDVARSVRYQVSTQLLEAVSEQVSRAFNPIEVRAWYEVWTHIRREYGTQMERKLRRYSGSCGFGSHGGGAGQCNAGWFAFFEFFSEVCHLEYVVPMTKFSRVAEHAGQWWAFDQVCFVSERPILLRRDEHGDLHAEDGPAVQYPDGWAIYAQHGIGVLDAEISHLPSYGNAGPGSIAGTGCMSCRCSMRINSKGIGIGTSPNAGA